ncbi:MAG: hypothetical protein V4631_15130 [Pseudomonadota bacterium]
MEKDSPLDTLEMVLAIARRIDLRLARMQLRGTRVCMELEAGDADALTLFCTRLHNVIGVYDIALNVCMLPIQQKYWTLRRSPDLQPEKRPRLCNPPNSPSPPPSPS